MMGVTLVLCGLVILLIGLGVAVLSWPTGVLSIAVVVAAVAVVVVAVVLSRAATVVRLDEDGYVVRWIRGAGVNEGRWKDVEDVAAATVEGERCVLLRRRDGSTTTIPVGILDRPAEVFVQDLQQHLNRGHGYRPLR